MTDGPDLVNDPVANNFRKLHSVPSGLNATLGDPEQHDAPIAAAIHLAQEAAAEVLTKVGKLKKDETRTEVGKHHVASQIFEKGEQVILQSQATLEAHASALEAEAVAEMNEGFETDERRAAIHTELRAWVRELAGKGDVAEIRKWMLKDREIAAVICHSPPFLLGLAGDVRESMMESCVKKWKPEADAKLNKAIDLKKIAARYSGFVRGLGAASFNRGIAAKWGGRIEP